MATQINIWASDELTDRLTELCPKGTALSAFARAVLERLLDPQGLPSLTPETGRGTRAVNVDWAPLFARMDALEAHDLRQDEAQRETLRAVHEHGGWSRRRHKTDAVMDQLAKDDGEQLVRAWERSVGR